MACFLSCGSGSLHHFFITASFTAYRWNLLLTINCQFYKSTLILYSSVTPCENKRSPNKLYFYNEVHLACLYICKTHYPSTFGTPFHNNCTKSTMSLRDMKSTKRQQHITDNTSPATRISSPTFPSSPLCKQPESLHTTRSAAGHFIPNVAFFKSSVSQMSFAKVKKTTFRNQMFRRELARSLFLLGR
jgi:hypothetical protein